VKGADFFRIKTPKGINPTIFELKDVQDFSVSLSRNIKDVQLEKVDQKTITN